MSEKQRVRLAVLQGTAPAPLDMPLELPRSPTLPDDLAPLDRRGLVVHGRPFRASSYTIYVDLPGNAEEMLLVHSYTGAYDKVSRKVATYVRSLEEGPAPKPLYGTWSPEPHLEGVVSAPSDVTIAKLRKRGYLTQMTSAEEETFFADVSSRFHHRAVYRAPGYILMPTYQCNLRCPYCFQDHMRTDPAYRHLLSTMQPEMVDRIFRGMTRIEAAHGIPEGAPVQRNITFFGGEPLLQESKPIIAYIMERAMVLGGATFAAISNGTELHAYRDLLGPQQIGFLQITIDGPPREHDRRRVYEDGSGSFARIAENVTMALELGVKISMRMNVDRGNIGHLPELADEFGARGWTAHPGFSAYVAPVHPANDQTSAKTTFNTWELNQAMAELKARHPSVSQLGGTDDGMSIQARGLFAQRSDPLPGFRSSFCGAHNSMYVIDAFADIYACWERTGDPSVRVGAIDRSGDVHMNSAIMATWRSRTVASNPVCRKCRYASYCGGGCAVLAEGQNGSMYTNHCDGFGKRLRASIADAYMAHAAGAPIETSAERVCDM